MGQGERRRTTKRGMGRVDPSKKEKEDSEPPPSQPLSCPSPEVGTKKTTRDTIRGPRATPTKKQSAKVKPPRELLATEPDTGRYATIPESSEEVVVNTRPRAHKMTMKSSPKPTVPKIGKTNLEGAKIAPKDAFLLSRIDGVLDVDELADVTGMTSDDVKERVARMAKLGLVKI